MKKSSWNLRRILQALRKNCEISWRNFLMLTNKSSTHNRKSHYNMRSPTLSSPTWQLINSHIIVIYSINLISTLKQENYNDLLSCLRVVALASWELASCSTTRFTYKDLLYSVHRIARRIFLKFNTVYAVAGTHRRKKFSI